MKSALVMASFAAICQVSFAQRARSFFSSPSALAMGDAYTAYDVGYEAVYYNPAGVAKRNKAQAKYFDLVGTGSQGIFTGLANGLTSISNIENIKQTIISNPGTVAAGGVAFLPQFLIRDFSIGLVTRGYYEGYVAPADQSLNVYAYTDLAVYAHFGISLLGGIVKLGVGGKALDRAEINHIYPATTYNGIALGQQWQEGQGYGLDAGMLLTLPSANLPTLGIAVQDIGDTTFINHRILFKGQTANGAPPSLPQTVNAGISFTHKFDRGTKGVLSFEMKNILGQNVDYLSRMHGGVEVSIRNVFLIRAGVNEGIYWTAGLGLNLGHASLEVATYGENASIDPNGRVDNRNYVGRYVMGF